MGNKSIYNHIVAKHKEFKAEQYEEGRKVYEQLKLECKTYGELERNIFQLERKIKWEIPNCEFTRILMEILEKEKNDLPLTNRSNETHIDVKNITTLFLEKKHSNYYDVEVADGKNRKKLLTVRLEKLTTKRYRLVNYQLF